MSWRRGSSLNNAILCHGWWPWSHWGLKTSSQKLSYVCQSCDLVTGCYFCRCLQNSGPAIPVCCAVWSVLTWKTEIVLKLCSLQTEHFIVLSQCEGPRVQINKGFICIYIFKITFKKSAWSFYFLSSRKIHLFQQTPENQYLFRKL